MADEEWEMTGKNSLELVNESRRIKDADET